MPVPGPLLLRAQAWVSAAPSLVALPWDARASATAVQLSVEKRQAKPVWVPAVESLWAHVAPSAWVEMELAAGAQSVQADS